jgi:hypothetical protein
LKWLRQTETVDMSNVVPFPRHEQINGVSTNLGRMSLNELVDLEDLCRMRLEDAKMDLQIVEDFRERMYPEAGGA